MLTVTSPASTFDLALLASVKSELSITDRSEDANLARWIGQASTAIAAYCNRVFVTETVSETFRLSCRDESICSNGSRQQHHTRGGERNRR